MHIHSSHSKTHLRSLNSSGHNEHTNTLLLASARLPTHPLSYTDSLHTGDAHQVSFCIIIGWTLKMVFIYHNLITFQHIVKFARWLLNQWQRTRSRHCCSWFDKSIITKSCQKSFYFWQFIAFMDGHVHVFFSEKKNLFKEPKNVKQRPVRIFCLNNFWADGTFLPQISSPNTIKPIILKRVASTSLQGPSGQSWTLSTLFALSPKLEFHVE